MPDRPLHAVKLTGGEPEFHSTEPSALFPWWSFTKTVICVCVLRLAEQGRLDLDSQLAGQPFTPRQLMQNRAGVPDYARLPEYHRAVARGDAPWSRTRLLRKVQPERLDFAPGTGWRYSNVGYLFLRLWLEEQTCRDLGEIVADEVAGPLGLSSVRLATRREDFAQVHWPEARDYDPRWVYHGCLFGTALDAARLLHALMAGHLIKPTSLAGMCDAHPLGGAIAGRPWRETGYGLGLMAGRMERVGRAIGHSGGGPFSVNAVYHFPELDPPATVAAFTDGTDEGIAELAAVDIATG